LLQGEEPRIRHWDDAGVSRELSEEDITRHIPGEITSQKPRTMILLLNKRCNLRCDFCDLWHYTDMMPFESAITIIGRAPAAGVKTLVITGGEPFVHPRIYEIIEFARNLDLGVNITTNGTLLVKDLDRLRESCVSSLSISIDGFEETHDRLRGVDGCWSQTMSAIETIQAETDIQLNIYFVVTNQNVGDLAKVYDLACERGIAFDFWPVNGYPHLYIRTPEERATYQAAIDHLAATSPMVRERLDYYRYGVEYMDGRRDHYRCLGLIEQFGVNHEGQLVPCCVWDQKGLQVGSALDEPLDQLFFSKRAQALREQIFNEGCVDQCFNHSLYEFQSATGLPFVVKPAEEPINEAMALIKESGQARGEQAKAARRAAAKARRARELADVERSRAEEPS
jgi:MoaA/NifB/PqqE/SkfB family radical SAM enzyme